MISLISILYSIIRLSIYFNDNDLKDDISEILNKIPYHIFLSLQILYAVLVIGFIILTLLKINSLQKLIKRH